MPLNSMAILIGTWIVMIIIVTWIIIDIKRYPWKHGAKEK